MAAPKGNQFWKARTRHGRHKLFESSEALWEACSEYFEWIDAHPLQAAELVKYQGQAKVKHVPRMRAMTVGGLCIFLDVGLDTWVRWRSEKDFCDVVTRVDQIIREQKFGGAAAEMLNPNIIARDLGLADRAMTEHSGSVELRNRTDEQLDAEIEDLLGLEGGNGS